MTAPQWVIDTNVLISAAITPGGVCDQIMQHAPSGQFVPAWDNRLLAEYRDVLSRPKFGLSPRVIKRLLAAFPQSGFHRGTKVAVELPDADDLPFLAVALATGDKTIVTGNAAHFPPATMARCGITILTPRAALAIFGQG
jgi:putative PIN family toxin of toxin-antitoxin system